MMALAVPDHFPDKQDRRDKYRLIAPGCELESNESALRLYCRGRYTSRHSGVKYIFTNVDFVDSVIRSAPGPARGPTARLASDLRV